MPTLDLACTNTHLGDRLILAFPTRFPHTHKYLFTGDLVDEDRHIHTPIATLNCLHKHTCNSWFIFYSHLQERFPYTHSALRSYLFHQCGTSLFTRDGRIANRTVRHLGVEYQFSKFSFLFSLTANPLCVRSLGTYCLFNSNNNISRGCLVTFLQSC